MVLLDGTAFYAAIGETIMDHEIKYEASRDKEIPSPLFSWAVLIAAIILCGLVIVGALTTAGWVAEAL